MNNPGVDATLTSFYNPSQSPERRGIKKSNVKIREVKA